VGNRNLFEIVAIRSYRRWRPSVFFSNRRIFILRNLTFRILNRFVRSLTISKTAGNSLHSGTFLPQPF